MARLSSTVLRLPILFISIPVGTEKIKNQKNTSEGRKLAVESLRFRSAFTKFEAMPTRSTKPITKKQSITGANLENFAFVCSIYEYIIEYFSNSQEYLDRSTRTFHPPRHGFPRCRSLSSAPEACRTKGRWYSPHRNLEHCPHKRISSPL